MVPVLILVNGLSGPRCTVEATTEWTVLQVHTAIQEKLNRRHSPVCWQMLVKDAEQVPWEMSVGNLVPDDLDTLELTLLFVEDLLQAVEERNLEKVQRILDLGAPVDWVDFRGLTPLHLAAVRRDVKMAKLLVDRGAEVSSSDLYGGTPLHVAAYEGHVEMAKLLFEGGAEVSLADQRGSTPLHNAARCGNVEMAKLLLERGADPSTVDEEGKTPSSVAEGRMGVTMVEMFKAVQSRGLDVLLPRVLTVSATQSSPTTLQLTCRTLSGQVAAVLEWYEDEQLAKLPKRVVGAVQTGLLREPVTSWNLAL